MSLVPFRQLSQQDLEPSWVSHLQIQVKAQAVHPLRQPEQRQTTAVPLLRSGVPLGEGGTVLLDFPLPFRLGQGGAVKAGHIVVQRGLNAVEGEDVPPRLAQLGQVNGASPSLQVDVAGDAA